MRAVIQRVKRASVTVDGEVTGEIGLGLLVLLGISKSDTVREAEFLADKTIGLRIFEDSEERMNLALREAGGSLLVVSQFTLYGDARRGRRPSFIHAAPPDEAKRLYEHFVETARSRRATVETGRFRAMMDVELINDGPVTLILDTDELMKI